jgi:hypothetical protein
MSASYGQSIASNFRSVTSIWQDDANYKDVSGTATFTKSETDAVTEHLSAAGSLFRKIPSSLFDDVSSEPLQGLIKMFNNSKVKSDQIMNPRTHTKELMDWIRDKYQKEIDKKKTDKAKQAQEQKRDEIVSLFEKHPSQQFVDLFTLMNHLVMAKEMIINKMNEASSIGTFLRTSDGFRTTDQEGFVAIDHLSGGAVKIVNRMNFSRANFSPDIIKGWQR